MAAEVSRIWRASTVVPEVVEQCRELLQLAESGELQNLAFFGETIDESGPGVYHGSTDGVDAKAALWAFECWKTDLVINSTRR